MKANSKYLWNMALGFAGYFVGLLAYNYYQPYFLASPFRYASLLLVILPLLWVVTAILRFVGNCDEMQRKIFTEGAAFAGLATAFTCFSLLFVKDLGANVKPEAGFYIFFLYYGVGAMWSGWRYR